MLKITNPQNNIYINQVQKFNKPEFLVSTNPIKETIQYLPNNYYLPTFGQKQNKFDQGKEIAKNLNTVISDNTGAVDTLEFSKEFKKITPKNIVPMLKSYDNISPKKSLITSILKETDSPINSRKENVIKLFDILSQNGEAQGVKTEHYKKNFEKELNKQVENILPIRTKYLNKITNGLIQAIDNKSSLTKEEKLAIQKTPKNETYEYTTTILTNTVNNAEKSFQDRVDSDGWCGKLADSTSILWNSNNRKNLVKEDIETYKDQVKELDEASKQGDEAYKNKFKEIFNVEYDPELVASYKNKEVELSTAIIFKTVQDNFKTELADLLSDKPLEDKIKIYQTAGRPYINIESKKEDIFRKNYDKYSEILGAGNKEDGSKKLEKKFKEYGLKDNSTQAEKFEVMQKMAKRQAFRLDREVFATTRGKSVQILKQEYNNSYNATFGVENDIAKRVTDYNNSQITGAYAANSLILGAAVVGISLATAGSGMGLISAIKSSLYTTALNATSMTADKLTSKKGLQEGDIAKILKDSALDGSTMVVSALAAQGIRYLTSAAFNMSKTASKITEIALTTVSDTAIDAAVEHILTGTVRVDGLAYSAAFSSQGQLLELKLLKNAVK